MSTDSTNELRKRNAPILPTSLAEEPRAGRFLRFARWIEARSRWLLLAGVVFYIVVFTAAACYKYWAYLMGFDLGVHIQVLWNTAHGRIAASSPSAGTSSYFGIDIILTELMLAPLYRLVPSVYMLLTLETIVLALGAVPVYVFAHDRLGTTLAGLVFAAAYLLYAPVEWMNLYEFQIRAFATTFLLCALYALYRRRVGWFFLWALLALGCRADVGLVVAGMGAMVIVGGDRRLRSLILFGIVPILLGLGWLLLCVLVLVPLFRTDGQFLYTKVIYGWLGDTPGAMVRRMLTDPGYVLGYVFGPPNGTLRLRYLLEMFLPFAFLPLLSPRRLVPALPIFALNLLSNTPNIHASTQKHYQALIIPFMLFAAIEGLRKVRDWRRETGRQGDRETGRQGDLLRTGFLGLFGSAPHTHPQPADGERRYSRYGGPITDGAAVSDEHSPPPRRRGGGWGVGFDRGVGRGSAKNLLPKGQGETQTRLQPFTFYLVFCIFCLALACNIGFRNPFFSLLTRQILYDRNAAATDLTALVPPDVAVAATNSLGPRLAQREQLYVFPGDDIIYPVAYAQRADYLVIDTAELTSANDRAYFDQVRASGRYRLIERRTYTNRGQEQELSVWQKIH